jgi:hypothetical protein
VSSVISVANFAFRRTLYEAVATVVRPASCVAFALLVFAVATSFSPFAYSVNRLIGAAFLLAFVCLPASLFLLALRRGCGGAKLKSVEWCVVLNCATVFAGAVLPTMSRV